MYYKVTSRACLDAYNKLASDRIDLRAKAKQFADEFDADPIVLQDSDSTWFCGIAFRDNSKVNRDIWTKPSRQYGYSWIRTKPLKKGLQAEFDAARAKYDELFKKYFPDGHRVDKNTFYSTLGLDGSSFFFNSFKCFEHEGSFYIDTTIDMQKGIEILGSEYSAAYSAHQKAQAKEPSHG
ncbi:TPA: hypothetical protein JI099_13945 [Acinetobacter baumannii]|uniref:hypothetical protein n=1 Tax=Acinetobacter baumannii TaxID=470 RepID=UPI003D0437FB|nr:hypothetical protein [Acinetobacter baumannii]